MARPDVASASPRRKALWLRVLAWSSGAFVLFVLLGIFAVPPLLKAEAEKALRAATGRDATIGSIAVNPFKLTATVGDFSLRDRTDGPPLLTIREVTANASLASLWQRAPVFDAVSVVEPRLNLIRNPGGDYNVQDLIDAALAQPEGPPPRFSFNNIEIAGGTIAFDDRPVGRKHEVTGLEISIPFLSSLPVDVEVRVAPRLRATVNGTAFALDGTTTPFATHREAALDVNLEALALPQYIAYLPLKLRVKLAGGALSTRLKVIFADGDATTRALTVSGDARLDGLNVTRDDDAPLIAAQRVAIKLDKLDVFGRKLLLDSVDVTSPVVDVRRTRDGAFEFQQPFVTRTATAAAADPGPAWSAAARTVRVSSGVARLADDSVSPAFRATVSNLAVTAGNLSSAAGERGTVKLDFATDLGASVAIDATLVPSTLEAQGRVEMTRLAVARLYPYYGDVLNLEVGSGALDFAGRFTYIPDEKATRLTIAEGVAAIADLKLALPGERQSLARTPLIALAGIAVDVAARRIEVGELTSRAGVLGVRRDADGTLNVDRLMKTSATTGRGDEETWTLTLRKASFAGYAADIDDRVPSPPVMFRVRELNANFEDLSNARGSRGAVNLRARVGDAGRVAITGPMTTNPFAVNVRIDADKLALAPLQPYLDPLVNVTVTAGTAAAKGRFTYGVPDGAAIDAPRRVTFAGDVAVADFAALDKPTTSDLAKWKSLKLTSLNVVTSPMAVAIGAVALDDFFARVIVYNDGTLNLTRLLTPGESPTPEGGARTTGAAAPAATAPAVPTAVPGLPVTIGRVEVARGNVQFSDFFVKPNYSANLTDFAGTVSAMSADQAGEIAVAAKVDHSAPVDIKGRVNPFARELTLDLVGNASDIELPPLSPYAAKYAGYGIQKGKLSFTVAYKIDNRKLQARNKLVLDQLTFGERVESPTATKLPVLLAVALLKDRKGVIDIELPIEGSLDDPQFSVGGLIVRVIVNLITKAVTAPFALLGALAGGGPELSYIEFAPGSAALAPAAEAKVKSLAKALTDRPGLKLEITGRSEPVADRAALETGAVDSALRAQKFKALAAAGNAPASAADVTVAADERDRYLKAAYRDASIPERPRNFLGLLEDVPPAQMEAMLRKHAAAGDDALRALAIARAEAAKEALAALGVPDERLFLVAPKPGSEGGKDGPPTRVDFSLR